MPYETPTNHVQPDYEAIIGKRFFLIFLTLFTVWLGWFLIGIGIDKYKNLDESIRGNHQIQSTTESIIALDK